MSEPPIAYEDAMAAFTLEDAQAHFGGRLTTGINACAECCDRWATDPPTRSRSTGRARTAQAAT